ncbi:MAG: UDP-N-acetylmuramoyl-L-alanyl-D-glutamate--2,6-diaminopimelate ligase [Planctomycetes bacterium]|nr:UDP-N-acetylmuramoyl-L-alanyl-D-glutamate--2,6-diaminopimelate ligase [Planctomycetota bacterium]
MRQTLHRDCGISLQEVLPQARQHGDRPVRFTSCCTDSRLCKPGDLFVALVGGTHDGHDFVQQAIAAGASAVLAERLLPVTGVSVYVVRNTHTAHGRICQALAGNPSRRLKVIGVTGTNGKTTTSCLIAAVLEAAGHRTGILGTLGYCDSIETVPAPLTTPTAPMLADWLARIEANHCSHAVMEVSSHALCQGRVAGVEYDAVCVTNVRRDHLDFHQSVQNYRDAKARLLKQLTPQGLCVLNVDDPVSAGWLTRIDGPVLTVAMDKPAEVTATLIEQFASEQTFLLTAGADTVPVRTRIIGRHHVYNCLVAAALGLGYGIDLPTVIRGLESVEQVPGRLERVACGQPFSVFVDYAHTADALAGTLAALRQVTAGRLICLFGAGGNRDRQKRPEMARAAEALADLTIVTSDNPRCEDSRAIINDIVRGFEQPETVEVISDRAEAIQFALSTAREGDCVLIAGKGHEDYQEIGGVRHHFDDREVARHWLHEMADSDEFMTTASRGR